MSLSRLIIVFNETRKEENAVSFSISKAAGGKTGPYVEKFVISRSSIGQIPTFNDVDSRSDVTMSARDAAENYAYYLALDYSNNPNPFTITVNLNTVTITATAEGDNFVEVSTSTIASSTVEPGDVQIINRYRLAISDSFVSASDINNCSEFKINLTTDLDYDSVLTNNINQNDFTGGNAYSVDLIRDVDYVFNLVKNVANALPAVVRYPSQGVLNIPSLNAINFDISESIINNSGTISINQNIISVVSYEYSINNGVDWNAEGFFDGLAPGNYIIKVREKIDNEYLNCEIDIPVTLESNLTKEAFVSISKSNSIYFAKQEDTNDTNVFENDTNSFAYKSYNSINYCSEALLQTNDETRIQLKSSYDNITVTLRKENGMDKDIAIQQKTDNLEKFKSMDCVAAFYEENKTVIYFNSGNAYDTIGNVIGQFSLNGGLPDFAITGELIELPGYGVLEIDDIIYLDSISKRCIVVNTSFLGSLPQKLICKAYYDLLNYNIFDFDIFWNIEGTGTYDILITFENEGFDTIYYLSENINIQDKHYGTVAIKYFNTNNRDIFYKYEIEHFIRVPVIKEVDIITDTVENNITDTSVDLVTSVLNEGKEFTFEEMSREILIKLAIALSCEYVFINREGYTKSDSINLEPYENTNLQILSATMLKNNTNYNNKNKYKLGIDFGEEEIDVPTFITDTTNFIKY